MREVPDDLGPASRLITNFGRPLEVGSIDREEDAGAEGFERGDIGSAVGVFLACDRSRVVRGRKDEGGRNRLVLYESEGEREVACGEKRGNLAQASCQSKRRLGDRHG